MADMDSDNESIASADSDKELQVAFAKGLLKPGLNIEVEAAKTFINNVEGLKAARNLLHKELPWVERLDLTTDLAPAPQALQDLEEIAEEENVHNDFQREMKFYRQAQAALLQALPRLHSLGIPTRRADDYFAEMAKSDGHMKKVREKLLSKQMSLERSEKAKKMRDLRKYGKQVQKEVLAKRQKDKREMMDQVKKARKGKLGNLDFLKEDGPKQKQQKENSQGQLFEPNKKRQSRNLKFGFGGQKKRSKYNTADSSGDLTGYSVKKHGLRPGKKIGAPKGGDKKSRPGKKRRQVTKNKKR